YRTLVEQLPAVTFMAALDEELHELYVSPQIETLLGFSQQEWLANPILWYTQLHPDDRERWQTEFAQTCTSGVHFRSEYRFLARDGRVVWVHGECQVVRDNQGRPLFLQGIAYDITERKHVEEARRRMQLDLEILVQERTAELAQVNEALRREIAERQQLELLIRQRAEQLAEENRRKDHFLALLAHELRNPLAPMHTSLEILRRPGTDREVNEWAYGVLERQVRHMKRLIDDLLDVARINQGKIHLSPETVDLAGVLLRAVEVTGPLLQERRHELSLSLPPRPLRMQADVVRLEQVLVNLLTNAAKYTDPGGRIWVSARSEGREAVLRVRDTGVGIPAEMLESIFDMFMQVDGSVGRTRQWGLGVGWHWCGACWNCTAAASRPSAPAPVRAVSSWHGCRCSPSRLRPPRPPRRPLFFRRARRRRRGGACWWSRTTPSSRRAWPFCCALGDTRSRWRPMVGQPSSPSSVPFPTRCYWTWVCRG
ncbi:MAG: PAS domain-containing sensor histidine kinase, partial [Gemmataceae bacterium]